MTIRASGALLTMIAALGWGSAATVVLTTQPEIAGAGGTALLYASMFMAFAGCFGLVGLVLRRRQEAPVASAVRQGMLLALCAVALLGLQAHRQLTPLTAGIVIGSTIVIESIFLWQPWNRNS